MHFFITLAGTYAIFMPMHYLGMAAQPRRYSQFTEVAYLQHLIPLNRFITYAAIITISAPVYFCDQSVLEHVQGTEGERQSLGSDHAGMDYGHAASARQLWRQDSRGLSRAVRVQRSGCAERLS